MGMAFNFFELPTANFNLQKRKACNYEATFLNKIKNRKSGTRKIKILVGKYL